MKKSLQTLYLLVLLLNTACALALTPADEAMIKDTVKDFMEKNKIPGVAVEIYHNGKPKSFYFGFADVAKHKPVTQKTIFEVGSISKIFTSLLFAQEIDTERMKFNTPIKTYFNTISPKLAHLGMQDLATHTSGLPFDAPAEVKDRAALNDYLAKWDNPSTSGIQWHYSNVGVGLLGYALEAENEDDLNTLYLTRILVPLKMTPIGLTVPKKLNSFYAQGYDEKNHAVPHASLGINPAAYGLKLTAYDMRRFLGAAIGLEGTPWTITFPMRLTESTYIKLADRSQGLGWQIHVLSPGTIPKLLAEPAEMNFGPIAVVEKLPNPIYNGNALIDKTGATSGFRTYVALIPKKETGIAIMTNKFVDNAALVNTARFILFKINNMLTDVQKDDDGAPSNLKAGV